VSIVIVNGHCFALEFLLDFFASIILGIIEKFGYGGIFILMALESANVPIPSEITMPFAGFLVSRGVFNLWAVVTVGAFANLFGSLFSYWLAVKWGNAALFLFNKWRLLTERDYLIGERWVAKYGQLAAFVSRLLPVARTFISFPAGVFRMKLMPFSILTLLGSFGWSLFLTYVGFAAGENWNALQPYFHKFDYAIGSIILAGFAWWMYRHLTRHK